MIKPVSGHEMHNITLWYGHNQTLKQSLSWRNTSYSALWYWVYQRMSQYETVFIVPSLTFLYISFPVLLCQNKVKKIVSFCFRFSLKTRLGEHCPRICHQNDDYPLKADSQFFVLLPHCCRHLVFLSFPMFTATSSTKAGYNPADSSTK